MAPPQVGFDLLVLAVSTGVLYLKFLITTMIQGRLGFSAGTRLPEDKNLPMARGTVAHRGDSTFMLDMSSGSEGYASRLKAEEDETRWKRVVQNDLESMPMALIVFVVAVLSPDTNRAVNSGLMVVYSLARVLHTVAYLKKRAVVRMISWAVGIFAVIITVTTTVINNA